MQKLRRGDPAGLEALMDRYTPYLSAIAARVLPGRPQDWEELTADVFLAAWENRRKLQPEKVKGWLAVTMRNRCINRLRALREEELPLEEDLLTLSADSPQRALEDQEAARLVREALDTLDRTDREALCPPVLLRTDRGPGGGGDGIEPVHRQEPPAPGAGEIKGTAGKGGV